MDLGAGTIALLAPHKRLRKDVSTALLYYESYSSGDYPMSLGLFSIFSWLANNLSAIFLADIASLAAGLSMGMALATAGAII